MCDLLDYLQRFWQGAMAGHDVWEAVVMATRGGGHLTGSS